MRADAIAVGQTIEHEGRLLRIARVENRARIELFAHPIGSPDQTELLRLRAATQVRRCDYVSAAA